MGSVPSATEMVWTKTKEVNFKSVPDVLEIRFVLMTLPRNDIFNCLQCSWSWFKTTQTPEFWRYLYMRDFPEKQEIPQIPSQAAYKARTLGLTNVPELDTILLTGLSYPGWRTEVIEAEAAYYSKDNYERNYVFPDALKKMQKKQALHSGDRSNSNIQKLDKLAKNLNYPGWEQEVKNAETSYSSYTWGFSTTLSEMKRKQEIHEGKRSKYLVKLDSLVKAGALTYPGWKDDVKGLESQHHQRPSTLKSRLKEMKKKQSIHSGDRSHPHLVKLDKRVKKGFSYPGWEQDVKKAENDIIDYPWRFDSDFREMKKKEEFHTGSRGKVLAKLDKEIAAGHYTYPGWQQDVKQAEQEAVKDSWVFKDFLLKMKLKQDLHSGNRVDPRVVKLDQRVSDGVYDYNGWQADVAAAEQKLFEGSYYFELHLEQMERRQDYHSRVRKHPQIMKLDKMVAAGSFDYDGWEDDLKRAEEAYLQDKYHFDSVLNQMKIKQARED